ncbi:MAG: hypothetical protein AAFQ92_15465 [Bacteroidota bacterium]
MMHEDNLVSSLITLGKNPDLAQLFIEHLSQYFGDELKYIKLDTDLNREIDPEDMEVIFIAIARQLAWKLPSVQAQKAFLNQHPTKWLASYLDYLEFLLEHQKIGENR